MRVDRVEDILNSKQQHDH